MNYLTQVKPSHKFHLDIVLLIGILLLMSVSLVVLYSAAGVERMSSQAIRFGVSIAVMFFILLIPKNVVRFFIPTIYIITIILLVGVYFFGVEVNGAQRWLDIGIIQIQPSELVKTAIPLMLAFYLGSKPLPPKLLDLLISVLIIGIPTALVFVQPDLGTSVLVATSGLALLFLAGISWRLIGFIGVLGLISIPSMWFYGMKEYQKERVMTFLNPESDPLNTGYNIIQSKIAIGSGGVQGKGWMQGTQSQLEFLPERTTDFIFAVFSEEFGLIGIVILFILYLFILLRGFWLAVNMTDNYSRLLAGALLTTFFVYFFVNIGMVVGILPVVGLPLPLISYGGTSIMTLMIGFGLIMSLYGSREKEDKKRGFL